jgi:glycosyltransferase involved in cell wall biosynthesis
MNISWNILIRPVIEEINANYIVEVGSDTTINTGNILEYCKDNNARMTAVAPYPSSYMADHKKYGNKFEYYLETGLNRLPLLKDYDAIIIEGEHDYSTLYNELKTVELNKKFPIIFFFQVGLYTEGYCGKENHDKTELDENDREEELEGMLLNSVKDFIEESKQEFTFKLISCYDLGIMYPIDDKLDEIVSKFIDKLNIYINLENEKEGLTEDIEKYQMEIMDLENKMDWNQNEFEYNSNIYRSFSKRLISKFPMLYMFPRMSKTGIKNTLINRKGFHAIKDKKLLNIGYYLTNNPDVKLSGQDPIIHYIYHGFYEDRSPSPEFDAEYYLETHPDINKSKLNPLVHYGLYGIKERRKPTQTHPALTENQKKVKGDVHFSSSEHVLEGFIRVFGDNKAREAVLKIDDQQFSIKCNPSNRVEKESNDDVCDFKFDIPHQFIDGKPHRVRLFDLETRITMVNKRLFFPKLYEFSDFSGFLSSSVVSPIINAPFREEDKRCFATMENVAKFLSKRSLNDNSALVSVIMPVHNRISTVKDAVDSVLGQTYTNIELIVVDDGSDDGSKELLEELADDRIVLLHNTHCKGVSAARNMGLKAANGKYIAYLDSDNLWDPRYLAAMVGAFIELPDADALYSGQLLFKEDISNPFAVRFGSFNRSLLTNRNYIDMNVFCHTRDLYNRIGGFDETLKRLVDYDLIMRIADESQIYSVPVLLSHYFFEKAQNTISKTSGFTELLENVREKSKKRIEDSLASNEDAKKFAQFNHKVSIIIPSYEAIEDIKECIDSILSFNANEYLEIIVVDNCSSKPVIDSLERMEATGKIKLIKNDINYGFTYAVNQGIELAEAGNDIFIMNNDALLTPGALESLQKAAYELPECGIVVPQQILHGGTKTITSHVPFAYPQYDCDVNLSAVHENIINVPLFNAGRVFELNFAPFFCVYIRRDVLDSSVGLDAEYGRHYRSDRIFCNYIRHVMKLKIYYIASSKVYHKMQKSTNILRESSQTEFDIMFAKNQWDDELASKFGYKKAPWDD